MPGGDGRADRVTEGTTLWVPDERTRARAVITRYLAWLQDARGLRFPGYDELW